MLSGSGKKTDRRMCGSVHVASELGEGLVLGLALGLGMGLGLVIGLE